MPLQLRVPLQPRIPDGYIDQGKVRHELKTPYRDGTTHVIFDPVYFIAKLAADQDEKTPAQRHVAMTWAQRLKRVFNIDVETCGFCGAATMVCLH
jgi:hypothetical protein